MRLEEDKMSEINGKLFASTRVAIQAALDVAKMFGFSSDHLDFEVLSGTRQEKVIEFKITFPKNWVIVKLSQDNGRWIPFEGKTDFEFTHLRFKNGRPFVVRDNRYLQDRDLSPLLIGIRLIIEEYFQRQPKLFYPYLSLRWDISLCRRWGFTIFDNDPIYLVQVPTNDITGGKITAKVLFVKGEMVILAIWDKLTPGKSSLIYKESHYRLREDETE